MTALEIRKKAGSKMEGRKQEERKLEARSRQKEEKKTERKDAGCAALEPNLLPCGERTKKKRQKER